MKNYIFIVSITSLFLFSCSDVDNQQEKIRAEIMYLYNIDTLKKTHSPIQNDALLFMHINHAFTSSDFNMLQNDMGEKVALVASTSNGNSSNVYEKEYVISSFNGLFEYFIIQNYTLYSAISQDNGVKVYLVECVCMSQGSKKIMVNILIEATRNKITLIRLY